MTLTESMPWQALAQAANALAAQPSADWLADQSRNQQLVVQLGGCHLDLTKQRVDSNVLDLLRQLAEHVDLQGQRDALLKGAAVNRSEDRPALHTALRDGAADIDPTIARVVDETRQHMYRLADEVRSGTWRGYTNRPITDIVHIGIGGSFLGPALAIDALRDYRHPHLRTHFIANIDAHDLTGTLEGLNPETTLFIVVSKSFSTLETQVNAISARSWFLERTNDLAAIARHFIAVSSNVEAAADFGLPAANVLPMWDWVGGRYSLWSAVGLPVAIAIGPERFDDLLAGARLADEHFASAPLLHNAPVLAALCAVWNSNFLGTTSHAVLPYDERLKLLPDYLQQLEMESNGKSVDQSGTALDYHTTPVLWGGVGTLGQHAYHQFLHQGTHAFSADFVMVAKDQKEHADHHHWLLANAVAQSEVMAMGTQPIDQQPYRLVAGNRPNSSIVLDDLGPAQLGTLLAFYEHRTFCQAAIWNINPFDQWGVEQGKKLALPVFTDLTNRTGKLSPVHKYDASTAELIMYLKKQQNPHT